MQLDQAYQWVALAVYITTFPQGAVVGSKTSLRVDVTNLDCFLDQFSTPDIIPLDELQQMQQKVDKVRQRYGLGRLTVAEKQMIRNAVGLGKGHWYKCAKGHYYAIGECGGAMETSKCPDCGGDIGGTRHSLVPGNEHASEFDDSAFAAYSNEASENMSARWSIAFLK